MDFLLECIGFPPSVGEDELVDLIRMRGEAAAWRGAPEEHRILKLGEGLEVRADRDPGADFWTLTPSYRVPHRIRMAVTTIVRPTESPFDALLGGWISPPTPEELEEDLPPGKYRLSAWISDARRLDNRIRAGHVLALTVAGYALNVDRIVPNSEAHPAHVLDRPSGALIRPLGGLEDPGGCCDVSLRIRAIRHVRNEVTRESVDIAICDAPDRPVMLFLSPWQLKREGLPAPRPGWRVEGTFLFTGRLAGGLTRKRSGSFG